MRSLQPPPLAGFRAETPLFLCVSFSISFPCHYSGLPRCYQTPASPAGSGRPTDTTTTTLLPLQGDKKAPGHGWKGLSPTNRLAAQKTPLSSLAGTCLSSHDKRALWAALKLTFHGFLRASELTSPTSTAYFPHQHLRRDIQLHKHCLVITVKASKSDQFRAT